MSPHVDILEQQDRLRGPFAGSLVFHVGLAFLIGGAAWVQGHNTISLGSKDGGGLGSVTITPVHGIPLPNRGGPVNLLATDTKSSLPPPVTKAPPKAREKAPDLDAVPIPSKNAKQKASRYDSAPVDRWHAKQTVASNQMTYSGGQRLNDPSITIAGGGGVGLGATSSVFGSQFGAYADLLRDRVAQAWKSGDVDPRIRTAPKVTVTFTLHRDGSATGVQVTQRSGVPALDFSAQRAILEAAPFPPLPQGFPKNDCVIEFVFELKR